MAEISFVVCDYRTAVLKYDLDSNDDDVLEWKELESAKWYESHGAVVELNDGKFVRLVQILHRVEPEDATIGRDFKWVMVELNALGKRIKE